MCRGSASPRVVMITDGQVHDVPAGDAKTAAEAIGAPLHVLLSGQPDEGDRRLVVAQAPALAWSARKCS